MNSSIEWPVRIFFYSYEELPMTTGSRRKVIKTLTVHFDNNYIVTAFIVGEIKIVLQSETACITVYTYTIFLVKTAISGQRFHEIFFRCTIYKSWFFFSLNTTHRHAVFVHILQVNRQKLQEMVEKRVERDGRDGLVWEGPDEFTP